VIPYAAGGSSHWMCDDEEMVLERSTRVLESHESRLYIDEECFSYDRTMIARFCISVSVVFDRWLLGSFCWNRRMVCNSIHAMETSSP
jgi:hypothetical protein